MGDRLPHTGRSGDLDCPCGFKGEHHVLVVAAKGDRLGDVVAVENVEDRARAKPVFFGKAKKPGVLVGEAGDGYSVTHRATGEMTYLPHRYLTSGIGDRVPVGINRGVPEHAIHVFDDPVRHGVFKVLSLLMDLAPIHAENVDQKPLHDAMPSNDPDGRSHPTAAQPDAMVGLVIEKASFCKRLDHRRSRPGRDIEGLGELASRNALLAIARFKEVEGLQIVFNSRGEHG